MSTWKRRRNHCVCASGFSTRPHGSALPRLRRSPVSGKRREQRKVNSRRLSESIASCVCSVFHNQALTCTKAKAGKLFLKTSDQNAWNGRFIFGMPDSLNSSKVQLVIARKKNI